MSAKWIAVHRGTKRDIERGEDFYRIGPELDVADPDCACPTVKDEWRANQIVNDVNATIDALATKDATIAGLEAENDRLQKVMQWISYQYDNQDMDHLDFRVKVATRVRTALEQSK